MPVTTTLLLDETGVLSRKTFGTSDRSGSLPSISAPVTVRTARQKSTSGEYRLKSHPPINEQYRCVAIFSIGLLVWENGKTQLSNTRRRSIVTYNLPHPSPMFRGVVPIVCLLSDLSNSLIVHLDRGFGPPPPTIPRERFLIVTLCKDFCGVPI